MRADVRILTLAMALGVTARVAAQNTRPTADPVLRARALRSGAPLKMFVPSGTVQLIGWDRDSVVVRGRLPASAQLLLSGTDTAGYKLIVDQRDGGSMSASRLVIYMPRASQVALKTVDALSNVSDVGGWFYAVSGSYHIAGTMRSVDVESMSGDIDLDAATPWARAKTGKGHLVIRGSLEDVDASTIGGTLDVATATILHGRFTAVTGDIHYAATIREHSLFEFSTHSGAIDFLLPRDVSARFELSSVEGVIDNGFAQLHPAASGVHTLQVSLGTGASDVTVRTFKGTVRLRARP
ncbi:MAG: DUF4097 family beta strand repeat-containing protein [Gemmatimonadaceae bacterium]